MISASWLSVVRMFGAERMLMSWAANVPAISEKRPGTSRVAITSSEDWPT